MKRISTIMAAFCIGLTAFAAQPLGLGKAGDFKVAMTPENMQALRASRARMQQKLLTGDYTEGVDAVTRTYVDKSKQIWNFSLLCDNQRICDMLRFTGENGQTIQASWESLPFYHASVLLTRQQPNATSRDSYIQFDLCWPSRYIFDQFSTYDGPRDEKGQVPESARDYSLTPASLLCNTEDFCKLFRESSGAGFESEDGGYTIAYYTMLPNELLQTPCMYDSDYGYTILDDTRQSTVSFTAYEPETAYLDVTTRCYVQGQSGKTYPVRNTYQGEGRIEGFEATEATFPEFGDMHLFNTGLQSSALWGDEGDNPFTKPFDELTAFYVVIGDKSVLWSVDPIATAFDREMIINGGLDLEDESEVDAHANILTGYAFADARYAKDTNLDPKEMEFVMPEIEQRYDEETEEPFAYVCPEVNKLLPYGYNFGWSNDYGFESYFENNADRIAPGSRIGWGTTKGFVLDAVNYYLKTLNAQSVGDVIYHYNPKNMQETRIFSMVGTKEWQSGVEGIVADDAPAASVKAANGVIAVTPAEAANVAVYTLDGACVKNVKAAAGSTVSVNAEKGVYVVVVNGKSSKVIL